MVNGTEIQMIKIETAIAIFFKLKAGGVIREKGMTRNLTAAHINIP